jgi:hypothetical protein
MSEASNQPQDGSATAPDPKSRRVFFEGGPSRTITGVQERFHLLVRALSSPDFRSRRGARLFFASVAGLALVTGVACHRYWGHIQELRAHASRIARQQNAVLAEFLRKRSEMAKRRNSTLLLGGFNIAVQPEAESRTPSSGYHLAELEIVVECDSKQSRDFLEENLEKARNEVTNTFLRIDRQDLMTSEGKTRMKHAIQDRLNVLLPKGHVESVFFSKLVLT